MTDRPWKIKYKDEKWFSIVDGKKTEGVGFFEIWFNESKYGFMDKHSLDDMKTEEILNMVEFMLNDAHIKFEPLYITQEKLNYSTITLPYPGASFQSDDG